MNSYLYNEINIGDKTSFFYDITEEKLDSFKKITGDINPLHNDSDFAKERGFNDKVVYGLLASSCLSTLAGVYMPGKYSLIYEMTIKYKFPVYLDDSPLLVEGIVVNKDDRFSLLIIKYTITNNKNVKVMRGEMKVGFTK